jgi:hypothetical protein
MLEIIVGGAGLALATAVYGPFLFGEWRRRRALRKLPTYTALELSALVASKGDAYRGASPQEHLGEAVELRTQVEVQQPLIAPLSGRPTAGYLLEARIRGGDVTVAVGTLASLKLGGGARQIELRGGKTLLGLGLPATATTPLGPLLPHPELEALFVRRGLDLRWASKRESVELVERCLPTRLEAWIGGVLMLEDGQLAVGESETDPRWFSVTDPAQLRGKPTHEQASEAARLLRAQRDDHQIGRLTPRSGRFYESLID